jgi:hypothetical protein
MSFTERTDAEVRGLVSASGDLSYNSTTGVFSFTERTDAEVRGLISVSGDLSYNSTTGVMSFTERTDSEVRGLLSGGTGVTYNNSTGEISIGQAVSTTSDVTFNDVIVSGDLTVSGTTTTINTETINLADNIILFNSNATGTPSENAGIEIERGDATNKTLLWNETDDKWTVGSETFVAGTFEGNVTGTVSSIANHDTDDLSEGASNLYYTTARFDSAFSGKSTSDLTEGTNLYYTTARFDSAFSGKSTSDLTEGTNLYYTTARANSDFDTRLATKSTSDLAEGANLYYTDTRANSAIDARVTQSFVNALNVTAAGVQADSVALGTDTTGNYVASATGGTGVTVTSGTGEGSTPSIAIGQAVGTTDDVTFNTVTATDEFLGDIDGAIQTTIRNTTGSTIYKGQAVYVTGLSGDTPTVALAKANSASTMPAVGIARTDINNNATGQMTVLGTLEGIDTSASNNLETGVTLIINDVFYVSATEAGNITNVAPTGESNLIQNLGRVVRVSPNTNMTFSVQGAGRTNATPNLNSGKIFYGNGSNQSVATTLDTSIVPENTNLYYTDARANSAIDTRVTKSFVDALGVAASTATTLATARDFSLTGDVTAAGVSFDGSGNVALSTNIGSNTVGITELNVTDGTSGQVLTTNGAGTLSFSTISGYTDSDVETYLDTGTSTPTFASAIVSGDLTVDTNTLYVDSTNNRVGIGTSSPAYALDVVDTTGNAYISVGRGTQSQGEVGFKLEGGTSGGDWFMYQPTSSKDLRFYQGSDKVTFDTSGNVGLPTNGNISGGNIQLGITSDSNTKFGTITLQHYNPSSEPEGNLIIYGADDGSTRHMGLGGGISEINAFNQLRFYTAAGTARTGTERIRINNSGHFLVGISSYSGSSEGVKLQKDGLYIGKSTTAIQHCARFENPNGEVGSIKTTGTSTQFNTSSDARLKDVTGSARGLEVINALNPVAFNWTTDGKSDEGLLAQEVQQIVPNAVSGSEEEYYQMDYSKLVTHLVAGMKEQQTLIEQLQAEVALLKGE